MTPRYAPPERRIVIPIKCCIGIGLVTSGPPPDETYHFYLGSRAIKMGREAVCVLMGRGVCGAYAVQGLSGRAREGFRRELRPVRLQVGQSVLAFGRRACGRRTGLRGLRRGCSVVQRGEE